MARRFSVEQANVLLPFIVPLLEQLRDEAQRLVAIREELAAISPAGRLNGQAVRALRLEAEAGQRASVAEGLLRDLQKQGVEVKDPLTGLIDLRTLRAGREVYLCWRLGEDRFRWWHDLDAGFQGRQPLP